MKEIEVLCWQRIASDNYYGKNQNHHHLFKCNRVYYTLKVSTIHPVWFENNTGHKMKHPFYAGETTAVCVCSG